jgi:hypothetical protein
LKFASLAVLAAPALFHFHLFAADQVQGLAAGLLEIRQDADGLRNLGDGPTFGESEAGLVANEQAAGVNIATLARLNRILGLRGRTRGND